MNAGRTVWQAQDAAWWRRERIVLLGEQYGSEGPAIANWLECEAKAQNAGGLVKAGYATAARGAFVDGGAERAREIVNFAVEIGFLREFAEGTRTFTAMIAAFANDQGTGREALTKAARRAQTDEPGHVRTDPDNTEPVPTSPAPVSETGEDRREDPPAPAGGAVRFRRRPVPEARLAIAEQALGDFNGRAGTSYGAYTATGAPSEALKRILGAITDNPDLTLDRCQALNATALQRRWWGDDPAHTGLVYGPKVIDRNLAALAQHGNGKHRSSDLVDAIQQRAAA